MAAAVDQFIRSQCQRHPELIVRVRKMKSRRHDADDLVALVVQKNLLAQNAEIRCEAAPPEAVADDHHM